MSHSLLQNKQRLVAEYRAVKEKFPDAELHQTNDELYWTCAVVAAGRKYPIRVVYPPNYPASAPSVFSVKQLPPNPHMLYGNELCWIDRWSGTSEWSPARDTAAVAILAAYRYFTCLLVYVSTGRWPKEADA